MDNVGDIDGRNRRHLKHPDPPALIFPKVYVPGGFRLVGDEMRYRSRGGRALDLDQKTMRREVFARFLGLFDKSDDSILDYAREWGVLGLCQHGCPIGHQPKQDPGLSWRGCDRKTYRDWMCESLERWRYYSKLMNSTVALRAQISKFELPRGPLPTQTGMDLQITPEGDVKVSLEFPGDPDHWKILFPLTGLGGFSSNNKVMGARSLISTAVNRLLELGSIVPLLRWDQGDPGFNLVPRVGQSGLFAPLAVELMLTIAGAPDYSVCHKCHKALLLRRGQSIDRRSFCRDCGSKMAGKEASRRYYLRRRGSSSDETLPRKRLTPQEVSKILSVLERRGLEAVKELAKKHGVSEWAIYKLRTRKLERGEKEKKHEKRKKS